MHKSGGRIPTDLGYRFYINSIKANDKLSEHVVPELEDELRTISNNVDDVLNATASMLSELSNMFSVVTISEYHNSILIDIELVELNGNRVMLVLGMNNGLVKSIVLDLDINIKPKHMNSIIRLLKEKLIGLSLREIQNTITLRLNDSSIFNHELIQVLIHDRYSYFSIEYNKLIYTSPVNVLLQQPEFQNLNNFKRILPALDKSFLNIYINKNFDTNSDYDLIGKENKDEVLQVMDDLRSAEVDFLTIGQYLQPSVKHHPLSRYYHPDEFKELESIAKSKGFLLVSSSPLTRSSYHADEDFAKLQMNRLYQTYAQSIS